MVLLRPAWRHISGQTPSTGLSDVFISFVYQAQGVVAWVVILLRPIVGLPSNGWLIILIALGVVCLGGMALLWTRRMWPFGILSLGWWGIAIVPSLILLSPDYVLTSPRLMYIASVGIALFDAALVMVCLRLLRRPVFQALFLALLTPLFVWGGMHLSTWVSEVARVPAALPRDRCRRAYLKPRDQDTVDQYTCLGGAGGAGVFCRYREHANLPPEYAGSRE